MCGVTHRSPFNGCFAARPTPSIWRTCEPTRRWRTREKDKEYEDAFWDVIASFSDEENALFLQFVTGIGKAPLNGFAYLHPHVVTAVADDA